MDRKKYILQFKWTVSRGQETNGYNICSLWVNEEKKTSCSGGGYDMRGTAFGNWIEKEFQEALQKLEIKAFYGLREDEGKISLDGACGFNCMEKVAKAIGLTLDYAGETENTTTYLAYKN